MNKQYLTDALNNALAYALSHDKQLMALGAGMDDLTIYPYTNEQGQEIYIKARFDTGKGKWIKPFYFDGTSYKMAMPKLSVGEKWESFLRVFAFMVNAPSVF